MNVIYIKSQIHKINNTMTFKSWIFFFRVCQFSYEWEVGIISFLVNLPGAITYMTPFLWRMVSSSSATWVLCMKMWPSLGQMNKTSFEWVHTLTHNLKYVCIRIYLWMKRFMKFFPLSGICDVVPSSILSNVLVLIFEAHAVGEITVLLISHMQSGHFDSLCFSGEMETTQQEAMIYGNILNDWPSICRVYVYQ